MRRAGDCADDRAHRSCQHLGGQHPRLKLEGPSRTPCPLLPFGHRAARWTAGRCQFEHTSRQYPLRCHPSCQPHVGTALPPSGGGRRRSASAPPRRLTTCRRALQPSLPRLPPAGRTRTRRTAARGSPTSWTRKQRLSRAWTGSTTRARVAPAAAPWRRRAAVRRRRRRAARLCWRSCSRRSCFRSRSPSGAPRAGSRSSRRRIGPTKRTGWRAGCWRRSRRRSLRRRSGSGGLCTSLAPPTERITAAGSAPRSCGSCCVTATSSTPTGST
mmetsp:Transcript_37683/g.121512  ORF Transcript_37683/g.121512 Transcript_37683/m.121512 type:complete len:271 (-) Transcript_37683:705-1517(-)